MGSRLSYAGPRVRVQGVDAEDKGLKPIPYKDLDLNSMGEL
jgi:hypothetical protein